MVTVKLMGGLGNQMFQYAIGRSLAHDLGEELYLDVSFYDLLPSVDTTPREYQLYYFQVHGDIVKRGVVSRCAINILKTIVRKYPFVCQKYVCERDLSYDPSLINNITHPYLDGYWQCEKYFLHNSDIIRRDFNIILPQSEINKRWAAKIVCSSSVCLHVRRGDYVTNTKANAMHGLCGLEYYHKAIAYILKIVHNPVFFVFSDDMMWTKDNLSIPGEVYYIDHNSPAQDYEDLRLMTLCKHFIIANSSFSWWGAWLGNFEDKVIIAPKKWFNQPNVMDDIVPDSWIKI